MLAESALDNWQQWDCRLRNRPTMVGSLGGGRSNRSYLLESEFGRLVLRINGTDSQLPDANRTHEVRIWQLASERGIAPPLLHVDEQAGFLVSTFIGSKLPTRTLPGMRFVEQALDLLACCHQLEVEVPTIDYASHIERYWSIIEANGRLAIPVLAEQREPMRLMLEDITNAGADIGLCHHDPVVANFVGNTDRLYLIDWEYAAGGLLVMDYAALGVEWGIDDDFIASHTGIDPTLLVGAKSLYRYICDLWEEQSGVESAADGLATDTQLIF